MSNRFVLQENSDGTVKLKQENKVFAEVCGKIVKINYKNKKIFTIHAEKMNKQFRCVLSYSKAFCPIREGDAIFGIAEYIQDSRYGDTLNITQPPFVALGEDENTLIKSFVIALKGSGFGTMRANNLLETLKVKFGSLSEACVNLDKLSSFYFYKNETDMSLLQPYSLVLKEYQMMKLLKWWYKNRNQRRLWLLGINNTEIRNAKMSPEEMYSMCLENPYKIYSLSMDKCDDIFNRIGKQTSSEIRQCAVISRSLHDYMNRGWSGIPSNILSKIYPESYEYMPMLRDMFDIKTELHTIYLPYPYDVEVGIADMVTNLLDGPLLPHAMDPSEITYTRSDLTENQKRVVEQALSDNICIIKGGGGTGKTTIIKEIVHNLVEKNISYRVVSFTGKAVARIREVIDKKEPMTMHMTITATKNNKKNIFSHLIIDEASMVTSELMYEFIEKFSHDFRITLIGDPNQLKPIGWGNMFDQLIQSNAVPTYTLTRCHRVENDNSGILINANNIIECSDPHYNGPQFEFEETDNFNIIEGGMDMIRNLLTILQNNNVSGDKITIISPYNKYLQQINKICQNIYNDIKRSVTDENGCIWKIGDRVMMTENNYFINVMNGDEGIITDLTSTQIQVMFKDGRYYVFSLVSYGDNNDDVNIDKDVYEGIKSKKELTTKSLVHSFGVSVHRYQGSEADYIIFYVPKSNPSTFLNRNLMYTAITRAKKMLWMVGDYDTMLRASTTKPGYRCDNLGKRLKQERNVK